MPTATPFHVYDTTLRDGAQQEGMNLSVTDKLAIAEQLDELGVGFIEGGWPGAVPKDTDFFARAAKELTLRHAVLAAFGSTRKAGMRAGNDPQVRALLDAETPVVTLVAKSDARHVERALRTTREENLAMIHDTVEFLTREDRRVVLDAEHFFDGYRHDADYAMAAVRAAFDAGAEVLCLCDTNGGMIPTWVSGIVSEVVERLGGPAAVGHLDDGGVAGPIIGVHAHNDSGCAVANTLAAVEAGATHIQGCVNGYGERTGNADLVAVTANLQLKLGMELVPESGLREATRIAHAISEVTNISPFARQPYVGQSAFTHKAGLHASAIRVDPDLYQHMDPQDVGNDMRMLVSDMAGRASVELKGRELGFDLSERKDVLARVTDRVKQDEARSYTYEAADASFELLLREELGELPRYFETHSWRTIVETVPDGHTPADVYGPEAEAFAEATVKITVGGKRTVATGEGNGPVDALDHALRRALTTAYPVLERFELIDFKVRILDTEQGTDATTRVLIDTADGENSWSTVGVGPNVIEAAWEALLGGYVYGLIKAGVEPVQA